MYDKKMDMLTDKVKDRLKKVKKIRENTECLLKDVKIKCSDDSKTRENHLIQKKRYLDSIAVNKKVYFSDIEDPDYYKFGCRFLLRNIRNVHKYNVLCGNHDKDIFNEIENGKEFNPENKQQCFQFALRAFIFHCSEQIVKDNLKADFEFNKFIEKKAHLGLNKDKIVLEKFIQGYKNNCWDDLETNVIILNKEVKFITCASFFPLFTINKKYKAYVQDDIFLNIFPQKEKSIILISYFKDSSKECKKFYDELYFCYKNKEYQKFETYLSKILVAQDKNIVIGPELFDSWGKEQKDNFYQYAHLFRNMKGASCIKMIKSIFKFRLEEPIFNLFKAF